MHVIIVGCGRVGSTVAKEMIGAGNTVAVVDRNPDSFRRLGADFAGQRVVGVGFDRDVLTEAGIGPLCSVAAVTNGDNSNILVARVARETFGAAHVVARIYDPARAGIYQRLGIETVASAEWTAGRVLSALTDDRHSSWVDPTSRFVIVERRISEAFAGIAINALEEQNACRVVLLSRSGQAAIPAAGTLLQQDDHVHVLVEGSALGALDHALVNPAAFAHSEEA
jgi:trk system potassium uptake protein